MKSLSFLGAVAEFLMLSGSATARRSFPRVPLPPGYDSNTPDHLERRARPPNAPIYTGYFDQLIDHDHPELGTFSQRYVWNADHFAGPGSPIILTTVGESAIDSSEVAVTNISLAGMIAQTVGGATVLLEHRYYGQSSPFPELDSRTLQLLNTNQSVRDHIYFAQNVKLPFDQNRTSTPDKTPWVMNGCSYPGTLTALTERHAPGTFWGYIASSAPIELQTEGWEYYELVKSAMPTNCSVDFPKIIDEVDRVLLGHDEKAKHTLKSKFGLGDLGDEDFAAALYDGLDTWQAVSFYRDNFHPFCDYVENQWPGSNEPIPGPEGVGAERALEGLAKWYRDVDIPGTCASDGYSDWTNDNETACWDYQNMTSPMYTDRTPSNPFNRQWNWLSCNEPFELFRVRGQSNMISRVLTKEYWMRQCGQFFPPVGKDMYVLAKGLTFEKTNDYFGGWNNVNTTRLMWSVGELEPWLFITMGAKERPGGPLPNTPQHPMFVLPKSSHCGDYWYANGDYNADVKAVLDQEVATMVNWLEDYYKEKGTVMPGSKVYH